MDFEKEIADTVAELPFDPPDETIGVLESRGLLKGNALIYRAETIYVPTEFQKRKMVQVRCAACGGVAYLEHVSNDGCRKSGCSDPFGFLDPFDNEEKVTGSTCICPCCGVGMKAVHIGRFDRSGYFRLDSLFCVTVHNVRGHLCLLSWYIERLCDKAGKVYYQPKKWAGMLVIGKKPVRVVGYTRSLGGFVSYHANWQVRKKFTDMIGECSTDEIMPFDDNEIFGTDSANCALEEAVRKLPSGASFRPATYLKLWLKKPAVENLMRSGCERIVRDVIENAMQGYSYTAYGVKYGFDIKRTAEYIDWKKVKPHEMLRIEKSEMPIAKSRSLQTLGLYTYCRKEKKVKLDKATLDLVESMDAKAVQSMLKEPINGYHVPPVRFINYLAKQRAKNKSKVSVSYIKDYWNMLFNVYGSMEASLLYPKDIVEAHDNILLRVKEKEDAEITAKIAEQAGRLSALCFADEETGLCIRPAESQAELIKEGKLLQHCVAGYAKEVAKGNTAIFFIRRLDAQEKPFFTLEFKNGKVAQNRGYHNCSRTEEVVKFEEKWLQYVKNISQKGVKKNGKQYAASGIPA